MSRATQACPRGDFVHVARLGGYYDLKYYRRCDHLIANTRAIVDYAVADGWPPERIDYLPNFVPDAGAATARCRRSGNLSAGPGARSAASEQGVFAAARGARRNPRGSAGDRRRRAVAARARATGEDLGVAARVDFLGWRDDVPALMAEADFLVCPSLHEPLGNVVIEAWSAGLPVVATASDGPAGLIEDEVSGLLVPLPGQPGAARRRSPPRSSGYAGTPGCAAGWGRAVGAPTRPSLPRRRSSPATAAFSTGWRPLVRRRRIDAAPVVGRSPEPRGAR